MDASLILLIPIAILISTVSSMTGIGGAVFFSPYFIVVMRIEPLLAFTAGLFIEVIGFSSGVIGYKREHLIDYALSRKVLAFTIPSSLAGVAIAGYVQNSLIVVFLIMLLLFHSYGFLTRGIERVPKDPRFMDTDFEHREYILNRAIRTTSMLGGLLIGMISAGLGEINEYNFLENLHLKPGQASGTSFFILLVTGITCMIGRIILFIEVDIGELEGILPLVLIAFPCVVIGAQIGVRISERMSAGRFVHIVGAIFLIISVLTAYEVFFTH